MIVVLVVATTYWQAWAAGDLADRQDNQIQRVAQFTIERGEIIGSAGRPLAKNLEREVGGRTLYFRAYPQGGLATHVVGYSTQSRARAGLERSMNDYLTGSNANLRLPSLDKLTGSTVTGNSLHLTLDLKAQRAALDALDGPLRLGRRARGPNREGARDGEHPDLQPQPDRGRLRGDRLDPGALPAGRAPDQPRHERPVRARLDLQGGHRGGRDRLRQVHPDLEVRRSRLLRGLRQAGEQLRHDEAVRRAEPARRAQVLGQLRLLQHRQGPRLEADRRVREALRLLLHAAARDAVERARAERPLQGRRALRPRARQRRRSRAASPSARSGCS